MEHTCSDSLLTSREIGSLKKDDYIQIKGHPCKIIEYHSVKGGKHGHSKAIIIAVDIFTDKKFRYQSNSSDLVFVPSVKKAKWQVLSVESDSAILIDSHDNTKQIFDVSAVVTSKISELLSIDEVFVVLLSAPVGEEPDTCSLVEKILFG